MFKKKNIIVTAFVLILTIIVNSTMTNASTETIAEIFPNNKFASVIADKIGKNVDDVVSQDELDAVTSASIVAGSSNVDDLTGIGRLSNLASIIIGSNEIEELPAEIGNLSKLKNLDINGGKITSIPDEVSKLKQLQILDLAQNEITEVNDIFGDMKSLREVNLSQNKIESYSAVFPSETTTLIDLSDNKLTVFPETILESTKLEKLYLSNNKLINISLGLDNLTSLNELSIHSNAISSEVPLVALKPGQIESYNLNNYSQTARLEDKVLYNNSTFTGADLIPPLMEQIRIDQGGSLSTSIISYNVNAKWHVTKPSGANPTGYSGLAAVDGSELDFNSSMFDEEGTYKIELRNSGSSMRYWGYGSTFTTYLTIVNASEPTITASHDEIELNEGDSFEDLVLTYDENYTLNVEYDNNTITSDIAKYENGKITGLKAGVTTINFSVSDNYSTSNIVSVIVKVKANPTENDDTSTSPTTNNSSDKASDKVDNITNKSKENTPNTGNGQFAIANALIIIATVIATAYKIRFN